MYCEGDWLKNEVEKKHNSLQWKLIICPNKRLRNIDVFYHVTDATAKRQIEKDGKLEARLSGKVTPRTASPIAKMEIGAVYFRLNLERKNDKLSTTSSFGTERVRISISNFSKYELFFNHYK